MVNAGLQNNFFHHRPEKQLSVAFQRNGDGVFVFETKTLLSHEIELDGQKLCILLFSLIKNSSLFSFLTNSIFSPIYRQSLSSLFHVNSTFKYHPNPHSCCYIPRFLPLPLIPHSTAFLPAFACPSHCPLREEEMTADRQPLR